MTEQSPTDVLEREHRCIEKVVAASPAIAGALEAGRTVPDHVLRGIVEFMRSYADRCHHGKEEAVLFPLLAERGVPTTGCPIGALTHEHEFGRSVVSDLASAIDAHTSGGGGHADAVAAGLRSIVELYPGHIWKEDFLLFPMSHKVLAASDWQALAAAFDRADATFGTDEIARLELLADDIAIAGRAAAQEPPDRQE